MFRDRQVAISRHYPRRTFLAQQRKLVSSPRMIARLLFTVACCAIAAFAPSAAAQAPGIPIEDPGSLSFNEPLLEKAKALREAGSLLDIEKVKALLAAP